MDPLERTLVNFFGRRNSDEQRPFFPLVHESWTLQSRIPKLYAQLYGLLAPGGTILICDHVNSSSPSGHRAAHFMTVEEHLSTFKKAGFINAREICPAADLSLMAAEKP